MNLRNWLSQNKIKVKHFAMLLDIERSYLHKLMKGQKKMSDKLWKKIKMFTLNQVDEIVEEKYVQKKEAGTTETIPADKDV